MTGTSAELGVWRWVASLLTRGPAEAPRVSVPSPTAVAPEKPMLRYVFDPVRTLTLEEVTEAMRMLKLHITSDDLRSSGMSDALVDHFRPVMIDPRERPS